MSIKSLIPAGLRALVLILSLCVLAGTVAAGETRIIFRKIAAVGDVEPGGDTFTSFGVPVTAPPGAGASHGPVAFAGRASGQGIWYHDGTSLVTVARQGLATPGLSTTFRGFGHPVLGQDGTLGFVSGLPIGFMGSPGVTQAIYRGPDPLDLVGYATGDAPGFQQPRLYYEIQLERFDDPKTLVAQPFVQGDDLGFYAMVRPIPDHLPTESALTMSSSPTSGSAIAHPLPENSAKLTGLNASLVAVYYQSAPAVIRSTAGLEVKPGDNAPGGGTFSSVDFAPAINGNGIVAFYAKTDNDTSGGLWRTLAGSNALETIALDGDPAPGTSATFSGFGDPAINDDNRVAVNAYLEGQGVDTSNDFAIYAETASGFDLLAREGDPAPGGGIFQRALNDPVGPIGDDSPFLDPHLNAHGRLAFQGWTDGTDAGIWISADGPVRKVAGAGDEVWIHDVGAELLLGVTFGVQDRSADGVSKGLNTGNADGRPSVWSDADELVFTAQVDTGETDPITGEPITEDWILTAVLTCKGDLDGDKTVGGSDLSILFSRWGSCAAPCPPDFDGDADVDGSDQAFLLAAWGPCP